MTSTTHQPGDRVRIQRDPSRDASYSLEHQKARQAVRGLVGVIRERRIDGTFRVVVPIAGSRPASAWFAGAELVSPEAPVVSAVPTPALDALWTLAQVLQERDELALCTARLAKRLADVAAAWTNCRAWWSPASEDERAALDAIDAALGGPAVGSASGNDAQVLRAACEAVTGTVGLPASELAARVLAGVQRAGDARARLHEPSSRTCTDSLARHAASRMPGRVPPVEGPGATRGT